MKTSLMEKSFLEWVNKVINNYDPPRPDTILMSIDGTLCEGPWPDENKYELDTTENWTIPHFKSK